MSELLYNKSKAVEELNKVEGFYPLELARVISNEGQEEQRYLDVKYRKLWFRLVNPTGKIISRIVHFTENMAVVEARIYLDKCDQEDNYIANSFSQKFRTADTQFGDKFLEMAETAAIGRALADAGYGLQFADVGEGNDPMQVDAGIPVNQGTQMQTAMPAQTPAPGMQQTPNQSAGTMPSFPPQVTPGQQMMEQFYQEAQANGNTIGGVTGTGQMTNPVMSPATGSVPVMQQMPSKPQSLDPNMPVEELVKWMSYEQAIQVAVTGQGKFSGKTMGQVETMMFQYTDDMLERSTDLEKESSGAYAGEASVIYVYEVLYKITGKQKYLEYAEKHCKILEYALKADENNDLIYGNAGAVIVLLNLYHLAQKDIYLQLACEAGNILIKNQNKGKWCCGNGQSLSGLSHGITGIIYALTKLNNEQFHIEYQKAIHSGLIYENTMYSDKYNNWLDNREEAKKEENSDNRCMAAWCHGAPGILLARSKMYNLVKDSSDYITVQCDIERALFATKMYGFTDNDCLCHGNLGNTEILLEYSKECNDEEVRHMMLSARTQIAMDIINENYDCARSYLHGYKIPGFMTGISGMGYSLLRDLYPELPCILALEI